ncbi:acidobacterial duplicated orphan permease [Acholeplasma oculi]|uniref:ABC transporter, periplasmic-binding/permease protein n=1 Tax=Acholeplasma oculi TaxID=35623 RepID=A0A061AH15_9MOLU|nr:ABC transporter permease [Acholeplasma oculi]CDR30896.1 ABC transporter, periplasmic-binding/permease protein [Acholeplasma oculi]SKC35457.1 putative ABC transport system permease protein [Acholeplasma oculi]SUT90076.1 acidobacterial duplicated orphan permease [Acholeplasma oculi]
MFLAFKELKYAKQKFALIIAVVVLVSYLVYFLTSLAYGLASSYTNAVNKWESDQIIMTVDANDNLMMSFMTQTDFNNTNIDGEKAKIGLFPAVIKNPQEVEDLDTRLNIYLFGIEDDGFLKPTDSNQTLTGNQVIVSDELSKNGYGIGDMIAISGSEIELEIIGFTKNATYQTAPVIYMALSTWQAYRFSTNTPPNLFSGIVVRGEIDSIESKLSSYTIDDYIFTLPGYTAQVLTFTIMIVFLIIIVAFVLGIFVYVLTIQKTSMFGVMKAQGISNGYIAGSVLIQTLLLVGIGIIIGFILTEVSVFFLSDIVPLATNVLFYIIITLAFFLFALFGGLFSVSAVLKIDPLKAIGG